MNWEGPRDPFVHSKIPNYCLLLRFEVGRYLIEVFTPYIELDGHEIRSYFFDLI